MAHPRPARLFAFVLLFAAPLVAADKPKYPFAKPPLELLDELAKADLGKLPVPADDERKLLAAVWEKKAKNPTADAGLTEAELDDLMLFASGVEDADARTKYKQKLADLRRECEKKLDGVTGAARGEVLMKVVSEGAMKNGYEAGQSSLAGVFDTGRQNCVSSTALVYLVGKGNGFDLRPMAIPGCQYAAGHAFLDLVDGKNRILVETTTPDGYDAETKRNKPGVIAFGQVTDRKQAREVDAVGLAAMIYANRGVEADKKEAADRPGAVRATLCALALDPLSPTAANNLLAGFDEWAKAEQKAGRYEEGVKVYAFALAAAPKSDLLWNNARCLWADYLVATVGEKKDKEAVELVARARKQLPGDKAFATAAEWFERAGHTQATWEEGIAVLDRGLAVVPEGERKQLRAARSGFYRQWSQKCLAKGEFDGSVKALAAGYARDADDKEIRAGIAYHMQEAMPRLGEKSADAAVEHFRLLQKEFPKAAEVGSGGRAFARQAVLKLAEGGKYEDALKRIDELKAMLPDKAQRAECAGDVYDAWGRALAKEKDWEGALARFVEGLKVCPKHEWLGNNAVATVDEWAAGPIDEKKWDDAIAAYNAGLKLFPNSEHLKHNKQYCEAMKAKEAKEQKVTKGK